MWHLQVLDPAPKENLQNRKSYNVPGCVLADPICYTYDCGSKPSPDFRIKMAGSYGCSFPQFRWSPRYWHMLIATPLDTLWKIASLMDKMIHQIVPNSSDCQAVRSRSLGVVRRFFAKPKNRNRNRTLEPLNLGTCCWVRSPLLRHARRSLVESSWWCCHPCRWPGRNQAIAILFGLEGFVPGNPGFYRFLPSNRGFQ